MGKPCYCPGSKAWLPPAPPQHNFWERQLVEQTCSLHRTRASITEGFGTKMPQRHIAHRKPSYKAVMQRLLSRYTDEGTEGLESLGDMPNQLKWHSTDLKPGPSALNGNAIPGVLHIFKLSRCRGRNRFWSPRIVRLAARGRAG